MLYQIADLIADVPGDDGMERRCADYLYSGDRGADIIIRTDLYRWDKYSAATPRELVSYMESGYQFCTKLLDHSGFYFHASTVVRDGRAYLFSGHSGAGKSTHTRLWISTFGGDTRVINDDKPALRLIDGVWYAYGTPWCGKDNINVNEKAPVAGLCFIKQGSKNEIRRLSVKEALFRVLSQTIFRFEHADRADALSKLIEDFLMKVPIYELESLPNGDAAVLSYETMSRQFED